MIVIQATCVPVPKAKPAAVVVTVVDDAPHFYQIPPNFKADDLLCLDADQPGTCATIADVKVFLVTRKVGP